MHSRLGTRLGNDASGPPHSRRTTTDAGAEGVACGAEVVALARGPVRLAPPCRLADKVGAGAGRAGCAVHSSDGADGE